MPELTQGVGGALTPNVLTKKQEAIAIATVGSVFKTNFMITSHTEKERARFFH
jgi:hypothetical protein